ncbi:hypothetical protein MKX01_002364 [Papaver californicum]|nr:hypothetical protein MKX01_002364 [Papaver californicum]
MPNVLKDDSFEISDVWSDNQESEFEYIRKIEFNVNDDVFAQDSIELLRQCGIDFGKNSEKGIDALRFGELLTKSGVVLNDNVHWAIFHTGYDFRYLIHRMSFSSLSKCFFLEVYDIKNSMNHCNILQGGLNKLAELLDVD